MLVPTHAYHHAPESMGHDGVSGLVPGFTLDGVRKVGVKPLVQGPPSLKVFDAVARIIERSPTVAQPLVVFWGKRVHQQFVLQAITEATSL